MKKVLTYIIIVCLMTSVMPFGLQYEIDRHDFDFASTNSRTAGVQFSETTIDLSTSCRMPKTICKVFAFIRMIKVVLTEFTTTVSGKLTQVKGTKYRKIITFENNGDPDAGNVSYRFV